MVPNLLRRAQTSPCSAPAVPGSVRIKPGRASSHSPAAGSAAAGSPPGTRSGEQEEASFPACSGPGELGRGSEEPSASPASPAATREPQTGFSCCLLLGSYRVHRAAGSRLRSPSLPASMALAKKIMTILNDFITVNCRPCSVNTGGAAHLALTVPRPAGATHRAGARAAGSGPCAPQGSRGVWRPRARVGAGTRLGHPEAAAQGEHGQSWGCVRGGWGARGTMLPAPGAEQGAFAAAGAAQHPCWG